MEQELGKLLFTFAVLSDSHVNEAEQTSASPFPSNLLANSRLRYIIESLDQLEPAFTVHLGDMGNPLPELATYSRAARCFQAITAELRSPLHLVGGNHCLGDKPTGWVPVPRVSPDSLTQYRRIYGRTFYSFDRGPCHFVALNSLIINSGLRFESEQREWVEADLEEAVANRRRVWIFMHYPAYVATPTERGSYDNVDEPGRSWLLDLFERFEVEAVFSGHVHNYFFNRYASTDLVTVPATSFVRQDYSDLFDVAPGDHEGGRNDVAKLGYGLVDVHEHGYRHRIVRSYGRVRGSGQTGGELLGAVKRVTSASRIGVELRTNWMARKTLRANNSVSPFAERSARNDWALLALQEMGVARIRLALHDIEDQYVAERMEILRQSGFEFFVYSHGLPTEHDHRLLRTNWSLISGWELILTASQIQAAARRLAKIWRGGKGIPIPCYLNEVRDIQRADVDDANVKHEANYGFQLAEKERIGSLLRTGEIGETFAGLVFRLRRREEASLPPIAAIREIDAMGRETGMRHQAHILFSGSLTSDRMDDDLRTASRVAESVVGADLATATDLWFDTFEDVDRGYFVRHGLVDRRYNPRLAAGVMRHLADRLSCHDLSQARSVSVREESWGRSTSIGLDRGFLVLAAPGCESTLDEIEAVDEHDSTSLTIVRLDDGSSVEEPVSREGSRMRFGRPITLSTPILLIARS